MSRQAERGIAVYLELGLLAAAGLYLAFTSRAVAVAPALSDTGKFRVGSELGSERAEFSGRPMVQVFTNAASPQWPAIARCLQDSQVEAEMAFFTGVLVDEVLDPTVEAVHRERDSLRVVARGVNGANLGGLRAGFLCDELVGLLRSLRAHPLSEPEKSPIYAQLLESTDPLEQLIQAGERGRARILVDFLKEFEGAECPAVQAAEARLRQGTGQ